MAHSPETNFQFLAEHSADLICRVGPDEIIRYASPSSLHLLGFTPEEMVGSNPNFMVLPEDLPLIAASAVRLRTPGINNFLETVRMRKKDGSVIWMETHARVVRDPGTGDPLEVVLVMRDITERKLHEEKLSAQALTDGLTGLANRRAFDEALEKEWKRTLREGSQMSLLMLDIDRFKLFNDHYGHQFGDDCLRDVASAVGGTVRRAIDIVARYGGEEIAVILPCTDADGAWMLAEKIRRAVIDLQIPHARNRDAGGIVTASIGVSTALAHQNGTVKVPRHILMAADYALYQAKHNGRNRVTTTTVLMTSPDVAADGNHGRDRAVAPEASLTDRMRTEARSVTSRRSCR